MHISMINQAQRGEGTYPRSHRIFITEMVSASAQFQVYFLPGKQAFLLVIDKLQHALMYMISLDVC